MAHQLVLYGTDGCHLCHDAQRLLQGLGIGWSDVDIVDDDTLLQRYGTRIPVLRQGASGAELDWPFDAGQLREFLAR